jgi:hypothetical protein
VDANPEGKAVLSATVADDDWQHRFTFLRLQPSLIWADESRPNCFGGTVEPVTDHPLPTCEAGESAQDGPQIASEEKRPTSAPLNQDFDYLDDLMDMLQDPSEHEKESSTENLLIETAPSQDTGGLAFMEWLREGISNHRLMINDSKAKVHTVDGTFFLVTPGIFQCYVGERLNCKTGAEKTKHGGSCNATLSGWTSTKNEITGKTFGPVQ